MEYVRTYRNSDGVKRTLIHDEEKPDEIKVYTEIEADAILKSIEGMRDELPANSTNKLVARIPFVIWEQSMHEQWDEADWKKWLNDPDNKMFRVWPGRV